VFGGCGDCDGSDASTASTAEEGMQNRRSARCAASCSLLIVFLVLAPRPAAQQAPLADLLAKSGERAAALADGTRVVFCEERYQQKFEKARSIVGFADLRGPQRGQVKA
jgi:hypothetical protein